MRIDSTALEATVARYNNALPVASTVSWPQGCLRNADAHRYRRLTTSPPPANVITSPMAASPPTPTWQCSICSANRSLACQRAGELVGGFHGASISERSALPKAASPASSGKIRGCQIPEPPRIPCSLRARLPNAFRGITRMSTDLKDFDNLIDGYVHPAGLTEGRAQTTLIALKRYFRALRAKDSRRYGP